jgi:multidrug efflux pump subunit AcrA (membrane-fusion protein)
VTTGSASSVTATGASLGGSVDPEGSDTSYAFDYGTTRALGRSTAATAIGNGTTATVVTVDLQGLRPNTTYAFQLVATNALGTTHGATVSFTTAESTCTSDRTAVTTDVQALEHEQVTLTQARLALAGERSSIAASSQTNTVTVAEDRATVALDEATVATDASDLDGTTLTSPIAGTVSAVNGSVGSSVNAGTSTVTTATQTSSTGATSAGTSGSAAASGSGSSGFITVTDLRQLDVVVGFPEADIGTVAVGQPATITLPALPGTELAGKVAAIATTSTVSSNVVTYDTTVSIVDPPATVRDGMTADVDVIVASKTGVLEVPSAAITTVGTRSTVTVLHGTTQTPVPVVPGVVGSSTTQIVSGLTAGEKVVLPTVTVAAASGAATSGAATAGGGFGGGGFGGGGFGGGGFGGGAG